jgi:phosphoglycerate kinase
MTTLQDLDLNGKKVLLRLDLNMSSTDPEKIKEEDRMINALPIINYIRNKGGIVISMSHFKRPHGKPDPKYSLKPVAAALSSQLGIDVQMAPDCIGSEVEEIIRHASPGDVIQLENLRFHPQEKSGNTDFAKQLAKLGDVYVDDAFGTTHRKDTSVYALPLQFDLQHKAAGLLMEKEIAKWTAAVQAQGPKYLVLGGMKLKEKIGALEVLRQEFKKIYVGGPIYNVIRAAQERSVGKSVISEKKDGTDYVAKVRQILPSLDNIMLPDQLAIAKMKMEKQKDKEVPIFYGEKTIAEKDEVPDDYMIVDCMFGPDKLAQFEQANYIIAFGPMGIFEDKRFAQGCDTIALRLNRAKNAVLGGGESGTAYHLAINAFISTGGGASIEFYRLRLQDKDLPAIEALKAP